MTAISASYPESSILVVGLDHYSLHLVLVEVSEHRAEPHLLEHHRFRSLQGLQKYLSFPLRDRLHMVGVQGECGDPLGIKAWLRDQNLTVGQYNNPGWSTHILKLQAEREALGLPPAFELAYTLAFLSTYKLRADKTVNKLWNQASELKYTLEEFDRELSRLSHALGKNGVRPSVTERACPF